MPGRKKDDSVHIDLAGDIVKALFDDNLTRTSITIPQTAVACDIICFARRRAQENLVSVVKQAPPPRYRRRKQDQDTETPDLQRAVGE